MLAPLLAATGPLARWRECPRLGKPVMHLVPCKTPLSEHAAEAAGGLEPRFLFTPGMAKRAVAASGLSLGLVVDLTDAPAGLLYESAEFGSDVAHVKIPFAQCGGAAAASAAAPASSSSSSTTSSAATASAAPPATQPATPRASGLPNKGLVDTFVRVVARFAERNPGRCALVHCTLGFEAAGAFIAAYLVEECGCSVEAALAMFAEARPPGVFSRDLVAALYARYGEAVPSDLRVAPPDWFSDATPPAGSAPPTAMERSVGEAPPPAKRPRVENDEDAVGGPPRSPTPPPTPEPPQLHAQSSPLPPPQPPPPLAPQSPQSPLRHPASIAAAPNQQLPTQFAEARFLARVKPPHLQPLLAQLDALLQIAFPGCGPQAALSQPQAIGDDSAAPLKTPGEFVVSWRPLAPRVWLLSTAKGAFVVWESGVERTAWHVPKLAFGPAAARDTLAEAEWVVDAVDGGQRHHRLLVGDLLVLHGRAVTQHPLAHRQRLVQSELVEPRQRAPLVTSTQQCPVSLRAKPSFPAAKAAKVLDMQLPHPAEGLVALEAGARRRDPVEWCWAPSLSPSLSAAAILKALAGS
jgi:hypothetical protein